MPGDSKIEWTHIVLPDGRTYRGRTWNPVTGCTEVSPGCDHCYARTFAERWRGTPGHPYEQGFDLRLWPERLRIPLHWRQPSGIFVNSMSDIAHKDVPDAFIGEVWATMGACPDHIFQVLTKRPQRLARLFAQGSLYRAPNVWIGTSVESNAYAWRVDHLRRIPAAVRFISFEPLLGPVDEVDLSGIDWCITGGESGPHHRPFDPLWAEYIRRWSQDNGIAYLHKQNGGRTSKAGGRELYGRIYNEYPMPKGNERLHPEVAL